MNSPISPARVARLIEEMAFDVGQRVLDVGCGTGELLIRVAEAHAVTGLGIDHDPAKIDEARAAASRRLPSAVIEFRTQKAAELDSRDPPYERAVCLGSTHAFGLGEGAYEHAIAGLMRRVAPRGLILVGEPYWKQPPAPEYLSFLGEPVGIYRDHLQNVLFAEEKGLVPLYAAVSSDDEWWRPFSAARRREAAVAVERATHDLPRRGARAWHPIKA